jgi:hypothetical protein
VSDDGIIEAFDALLKVYERRLEMEELNKLKKQKALSTKKTTWFGLPSQVSTAESQKPSEF